MGNTFKLQPDAEWPDPQVDPYIRLAVALTETEPGESADPLLGSGRDVLEVMAEIDPKDGSLLQDLAVPPEFVRLKLSHVTGTIDVPEDRSLLRARIAGIRERVRRLKLAVRQQPRLRESLLDMGHGTAPPWKAEGGTALTGQGVIVGIIDDGCAFAHRNFLNRKEVGGQVSFESRVLCLWDQSEPDNSIDQAALGWIVPSHPGYGRELRKSAIDATLVSQVNPETGAIREDAVYEALAYRSIDFGAHGTHVMDIAAGNGKAVGCFPGVAPAADIIFVQIPKSAIGNPADSVLSSYILDGCAYIFAKAQELGKPAVVNISYGGYGGPHDGTSLLERGIDEMLVRGERTVVISAGNALAEDCHASGTLTPGEDSAPLAWLVGAEDPTLNLMEIWYSKDAALKITLAPPNAPALAPIDLGSAHSIRQEDGKIVGWVFHRKSDSGNDDHHMLIALRPTKTVKEVPEVAPAPAGTWTVGLYNAGTQGAEFHAWIERDDAGSRSAAMMLQSRFSAASSSPQCTLGSLATGSLAISVGACNTATQEVCRYSSCGPTRDKRPKPDVCAPAEEDAAEHGVLSAAALSAQPTRMNGTSAAAPHVAGLVALLFEAARKLNRAPLSAKRIRKLVTDGARNSTALKPNGRWESATAPALCRGCVGAGKVDAIETIAAV